MKRKGFPHVAKQTHEVFYPTASRSKRNSKIRYSETKPRRRELVLGIPRKPTHKAHAQRLLRTNQLKSTKYKRYISV